MRARLRAAAREGCACIVGGGAAALCLAGPLGVVVLAPYIVAAAATASIRTLRGHQPIATGHPPRWNVRGTRSWRTT